MPATDPGPPPAVVGRVGPLAELADVAATPGTAPGHTACLVGPPGIGKSALARAFTASLEGWTVLVGRCSPPPAAPWRALSELAVDALGRGADLDAVETTIFGPAVRTLVGIEGRTMDADHQAMVISEALLRLVGTCPSRPVALVVEDLHWVDDETLAALDYLVDHVAERELLVLTTSRDHESTAADEVAGDWQQRGVARVIPLGPLDADAVEALVEATLGTSAPRSFVDAVAGAADGNPLLVEEFTREAMAGDALRARGGSWSFDSNADLAVPSSYRAAVERRVGRLDDGDRAIVQLAALIGRVIDPETLMRCGVPEAAARVAAVEAARVQLAVPDPDAPGTARFHHALTSDAVAASLSDGERARLADAALDELERGELERGGMDAQALEAAARLAAATGDAHRAGALLLEAARRAVAVGSTDSALARLDAAEALPDGEALFGADVRELRVEAMALAGRAGEALAVGEQLLHDLAARGDDEGRDRIQLALARALGGVGDWPAAAARLDDAFADLDAADADVVSTRAIAAIEVGDVETAARLATATLEGGAGAVAVCQAREVLGRVARETSYLDAAEHFRAGVEAASAGGLELWRARALLELGLSEATLYGRPDVFVEADRSAVAAGALALSAMVSYNLANLLGIGFDSEGAVEAAERCIDTAHRLDAPRLEALGWVTAGQAHAGRGDRGRARLAGDEARRARPDDPETDGLAWGMCTAWADLLHGDVDAAVEGYATSLGILAGLPVPTATIPWYFGPVVLAAADHPLTPTVRAQLDAPAFRAVPTLDAGAALVDAVTAAVAGDTAAVDGHLDAHRARLDRHADLAAHVAGGWHAVRAVVAPLAARAGWGEPLDDLQSAQHWFNEHGCEPAARWCGSIFRSLGGTPRSRGRGRSDVPAELAGFGVTAREHEVLLLLGERLTNKEIADRLTVSPSTVKTHVERLLAKTGRRNRVELAELAEATDPV